MSTRWAERLRISLYFLGFLLIGVRDIMWEDIVMQPRWSHSTGKAGNSFQSFRTHRYLMPSSLWQTAESGRCWWWTAGISRAAVEYDRKLLEQLDGWQAMLGAASESGNSGSGPKKKKTKTTTDLLIAKNPKNAYPIYLLFKKSERFTKDELFQAVNSLNETPGNGSLWMGIFRRICVLSHDVYYNKISYILL